MKQLLRKWFTILIVNCLLVASLPAMNAFAETKGNGGSSGIEPPAVISAEANLQSNVQDGVILHAFNWSYNSIKEKLPEIAAAGYSTVQTSPVQQPRDYSLSNDVAGQWRKLYQPVSMQIAQQSWLGTKEELTSLCSEAHKYDIKIICDIVSNHFANLSEQAGSNSISDQVKTYQPDFYNNKSSYFRNNNFNADDSSIQKTVQGHVSNCPDLNTNNSNVQHAALNLLKECIDCGVDGFRFDSAKHIETPSDGSYASQYWPTVVTGAKAYYLQKTGKNLFIYGEILNTCGTGRSFNNYTSYINVTDNKTGDAVLAAVNNKNASAAASSQYKSGVAASQVVLWAESHNTYEGDSGSGGLSNTSGVVNETVAKAWAIVASRKDATALFFARPGLAHMGEATTDATYKSTAVAEVNKFHNLFTNESEKLDSSGSIAYVQRGGKGIVLVNVSGNATSVNITSTGMTNGTYTDMISGSTFSVSNGTLTGSIGSTGIAVIYNGKPTPRATSSLESCTFNADTATMELSLENAVLGTFCLDDSSPVAFTDGTAIRIGSDYNYKETITLTLTATDKYGTTKTNIYKYKKEQNTGSGIYIWLNPAKKTNWKGPFNVWVYDDQTFSKSRTYSNAPERPGEAMTYDEAQKMWYYEVPTTSYLNGQPNNFDLSKSSKAAFIISATSTTTNQTVQFPAANSSGVAPYQYLNGHSWEYAVTSGTSITISTRKPTVANIPAIDVTRGYEETTTEEPTTEEPTTEEPTTEEPTTEEPTTEEPTTEEPTTEEPTTEEPTTEEPDTEESSDVYVLAGTNILFSTGWSPDPDSYVMAKQSDGTYSCVITDVMANTDINYELKVVKYVNGDPSQAIWYGINGTDLNYEFSMNRNCDITVTFNPETSEINVTGDGVAAPVYNLKTIHVVGEGKNGFLGNEEWNYNANVMEEIDDDLYEISYENVDANTEYQFKFTANGSWNISWGAGMFSEKTPNTPYSAQFSSNENISFTTDSETNTVDITITLDLTDWDSLKKGGAVYMVKVDPHTEEPTTEEPTTMEPTTVELTTEEPTTVEPTTEEPTTVEPTTEEPTTVEPTTEEPTTGEPTTEEPTTEIPTIEPMEVPTTKPVQSPAEAAKEAINAKSNGSSSNNAVTIYWGKTKGATKYVIYATYCGAKKYKKIATVKGNITKYDITKLNGKKLNQKKNVKAYVVAYKGKIKLTKSLKLHVAGYNTKYSNVKKIKIKKKRFTLDKGKTAKIKGKIILEDSNKKPVIHTAKLRFFSNNKKIATVTKKGKITAKEKGSCIIYVYSNNGKAKKVKVKVK